MKAFTRDGSGNGKFSECNLLLDVDSGIIGSARDSTSQLRRDKRPGVRICATISRSAEKIMD